MVISPVFAQVEYLDVLPSNKGTLNVGLATIPTNPTTKEITTLKIDFINPKNEKIQEHIDYTVAVTKDGDPIFGPIPLTHTSTGSVKIPVEFQKDGEHQVIIAIEGILFQPIPQETVLFNVLVGEPSSITQQQDEVPISEKSNGGLEISGSESGGCLIATATFGSELAPQVQFLREIRDNTVLSTASGTSFMTAFNAFYYSFSPAVADIERQNPVFKETVKVAITPLLSSLSLLQYVDIDSETEMLGYGIGIILLNFGMYFVAPALIIFKLKNRKQ